MTHDAFEAVASLIRQKGPTKQAAYLVLVCGQTVPDAARTAGLEYKYAHKAVQRVRTALQKARVASGLAPGPGMVDGPPAKEVRSAVE